MPYRLKLTPVVLGADAPPLPAYTIAPLGSLSVALQISTITPSDNINSPKRKTGSPTVHGVILCLSYATNTRQQQQQQPRHPLRAAGAHAHDTPALPSGTSPLPPDPAACSVPSHDPNVHDHVTPSTSYFCHPPRVSYGLPMPSDSQFVTIQTWNPLFPFAPVTTRTFMIRDAPILTPSYAGVQGMKRRWEDDEDEDDQMTKPPCCNCSMDQNLFSWFPNPFFGRRVKKLRLI